MSWYVLGWLLIAGPVAICAWIVMAQRLFEGTEEFVNFFMDCFFLITFGLGFAAIIGLAWPLVLVLFGIWKVVQ